MSREGRFVRRRWLAIPWIVLGTFVAGFVSGAESRDPRVEARKRVLPFYSTAAMQFLARVLDVEQIRGKRLPAEARSGRDQTRSEAGLRPPVSETNFSIESFPNLSENEPTVAANPRHPNRLVSGMQVFGSKTRRCVAHYSRNGGKNWNADPIVLAGLTDESICADPVLAYAPDGSRVYFAFLDLGSLPFLSMQIAVSWSDDDGRTWEGPVAVLSSSVGDYDKPWIGTHVPVGDSQGNSNWVYVTATRFDFPLDGPFPCRIMLTRSADKGASWTAPMELDGSVDDCGQPILVHGSRPTGGVGPGVLVAWYNSGTDGPDNGQFEIRTRYSADNGETFGPVEVAASDGFELPFALGPNGMYHRWSAGMFPDVEVAPNGSGHIVYTHDPVADPADPEDGDIRYVGSAGPPYAAWSAPTTVNDDTSRKAQGFPALKATSDGGETSLYVIWEDHRNSTNDNREYDIFWARRTDSGTPGPWGVNQKLTNAPSVSDVAFIGDYFDLTLARRNGRGNDPFVYGVWTDRRDQSAPTRTDDDVWGARIPIGHDDD